MRFKRTPATTDGIIRIINALYSDYERRERLLESEGSVSQYSNFAVLNRTLWASVEYVCEPNIRTAMFYDLCHDLGYDKSSLACIMCHKTYYSRKKAVKLEAARRLGLM